MRLKLLAGLLYAAALALPAHADVLDFEGMLPRGIAYTQELEHKGYTIRGESAFDDALPTDLVGGILKGSNSGDCLWLSCPVNNSSTYYAGLNDGVMLLSRDDHKAFSLLSLDASFIGAYQGVQTPPVAGILRVQGLRADSTYATFDVELHQDTKQFYFDSVSTGDFGKEQFISMAFFGFACDFSGSCFAFENNQGQFGIDNLNVSISAVPEPSGLAMMGTGALLMGVIARRRKNRAFKENP